MSRVPISITLSLSTFFAAMAQSAAPQPTKQWRKAASIIPGTHILVRERSQHTTQACTLVWIDNTALACDVYAPTQHRVIYPAAMVASVVEETTAREKRDGTHLAVPLMAMAAGAVLGGLAGSGGGAGGAAAGAMFGGGVAGSMTLAAQNAATQ